MGLLWGVGFHWSTSRSGRPVRRLRVRDDDRLPPLLHAPGLRGAAPVKATLAILGCMTMQGPLTQWVTDHRKHHALSDKPGDPHSPHVGHGDGAWARCAASCTRTSAGCSRTSAWSRAGEYGKELYEDRLVRWIDRLYLLWVVPHARDPVRDRLRGRRHVAGRARGAGLGRPDPDLRLPARHVQRELDLPHVRAQGLPLARRGPEQLARRGARLRRGLAQQPPRLPGLRAARAAALAVRRLVVGDPRRSSGSASSGT